MRISDWSSDVCSSDLKRCTVAPSSTGTTEVRGACKTGISIIALHPLETWVMTNAQYPALRLLRTRASAWSRALHRETVLTPSDLIWPLFVTEGSNAREPIASLPGVERLSLGIGSAQV